MNITLSPPATLECLLVFSAVVWPQRCASGSAAPLLVSLHAALVPHLLHQLGAYRSSWPRSSLYEGTTTGGSRLARLFPSRGFLFGSGHGAAAPRPRNQPHWLSPGHGLQVAGAGGGCELRVVGLGCVHQQKLDIDLGTANYSVQSWYPWW